RAALGKNKKAQIRPGDKKTVAEGLKIRQLNAQGQRMNEDVQRETKKEKQDIAIVEKETELRDFFGTSVNIRKTKNRGKIEIEFFSDDDLERILELLDQQQ